MTRSLGNKLPEDEVWEVDLYINKHRYRSIIRVLTRSQKANISDILEVGL